MTKSHDIYASIIITTYNRPGALKLVLMALSHQTDSRFEVVVADDGSEDETRDMIEKLRPLLPYPIKYIWQEDKDFRAATIRNTGILTAQGDYIIFLDGDCIPFPDFVEKHIKLAEHGYLVAGNRMLLSRQFSEKVISEQIPLYFRSGLQWLYTRISGNCNRLLLLIRLPDGPFRKWHTTRWWGMRSCNMAVWKDDLLRANGFDERYQGWGREDSDLVIRLLNGGVLRKDAMSAIPVLHLWHADSDRSNLSRNEELLASVQDSGAVTTDQGIKEQMKE